MCLTVKLLHRMTPIQYFRIVAKRMRKWTVCFLFTNIGEKKAKQSEMKYIYIHRNERR
jgi:hypothetical protein